MLHADIEGALRTALLADTFDWTWTPEDLPRFCAAAGWQLTEVRELGASITTNLEVDRPTARVHGRPGKVTWISTFVTDIDTDATEPDSALLAELVGPLAADFGPAPATPSDNVIKVRWDRPSLTVQLAAQPGTIALWLTSPEHQLWLDKPDDDEDDAEGEGEGEGEGDE